MLLRNASVLGAAMMLAVSVAHANPGQNTTPGNPQGAPAQQADQPHERGTRSGLETRDQTRQPAPDGTPGRPNQPGSMGSQAPGATGQAGQPGGMNQGNQGMGQGGQGGMGTQTQPQTTPGQHRTQSPGHPQSGSAAERHRQGQ